MTFKTNWQLKWHTTHAHTTKHTTDMFGYKIKRLWVYGGFKTQLKI